MQQLKLILRIFKWRFCILIVFFSDIPESFAQIHVRPETESTRIPESLESLQIISDLELKFVSDSVLSFICTNAVGCQNVDNDVAYYSSTNSGYSISDQFVPLTAGPLNSVCWYGVYYDPGLALDCSPGPGDDFKITYLYDNNGEPGDTLAGPFSVTPVKALTGNFLLNSVAVYGYESTHPTVSLIPFQLYWISIVNNITTGDCRWGWVTSSQGDSIHFLNDSIMQIDDLAFCLNVPIKPDGGLSAAPHNDICDNAISVGINTTIFSSTLHATTQDAPPYCGTLLNTGPGIWYTLTGTGQKVEISTCHQNTGFDTKIAVFSGSCSSLTCIAGNDDMGSTACGFSGDHSLISFCTDSLAEYYIYVTGYGQYSGSLGLQINSVISDPPAFVQCPADITQNNTLTLCEAFVSIPEPLFGIDFTDDCGAFVFNDINNTADASGIFPVGLTQLTWTAVDSDGQVVTCVQNVTVVDIENPVIICPPDTIIESDPGSSSATGVNPGVAVVSDNCGVLSVTHDGVEPYPVGTTLLTWTVTDVNGNTEICYQALEVTPYVGYEVMHIETSHLSVIPNPATEIFTVTFGITESTFVSLKIVDVFGNEKAIILFEDELNKGSHSISISAETYHLSKGLYVLVFTTDQDRLIRKIILN